MQLYWVINDALIASLILLYLITCPAICRGDETVSGTRAFFEPGIELPTGEGRALVLSACTGCHNLEGVPAYKEYWGYDRWLPMVENMIKHGAQLNDKEKITVTLYLAKHFGRD